MADLAATVNPNMDLHSTTPLPIYRAGRRRELLVVTHEDLCTYLGRQPVVSDKVGRFEVREHWAWPHVWNIEDVRLLGD